MKRVGLVLLIAGCGGPKILEFRVEPQFVCQDDTVRIRFAVKGTPYLETVRRGGGGVDTTRYRILSQRRGKTAFAEGDVLTFAGELTMPLVFPTRKMTGDSIGARDTLPPSTWPDRVRIALTQADSGRKVTVRHGGREVALIPGTSSSVLAGLPVHGAWELTSAILPNEVLGDPVRHPPGKLYLGLSLSCGKGTSP